MTTYTWTDNAMQGGTACDVDKVNENLMHLKYNAGGLLPVNNLGTKTSNFTLEPNKIDTAEITASLTIALPTTGFISGVENKCILDFTTTSSSSPTLPSGLKWSDKNSGSIPSSYSTTSGVRNVLTFTTLDGGTTWEAEYKTYGAQEVAYTMPVLTADGTIGGSSVACSATNQYSGCYAYMAYDNNNATASMGITSETFITYFPEGVKIPAIDFYGYNTNAGAYSHSMYVSNDNSTYTLLGTGAVAGGAGVTTRVDYSGSSNLGFYKYYKEINTLTSGPYIQQATKTLINPTHIQV